jgi:hypothetical protein
VVTSNKQRILEPICNEETHQKKMQMPKHEKVELVPVEWLQQIQTSHLLYDSITPKERAQNTAGKKKLHRNLMFSSNHLVDGRIEKSAVVLLTKMKPSGQSFHIHKKAALATWEHMLHPQLMPKYMPKDTLNANDCGVFYKLFLTKCTH